ncbi:putative WRKY transcription factor 65 [Hibiscus syriacus]|uniref:WRKY transcription factor 65 n=1 Tax=Hibiscus syriacus TaxID=106335 RepID=A0A6A3C729_HIBSY|nr:putative WRKY transcription factor 65 [Hibiscus syriacus]
MAGLVPPELESMASGDSELKPNETQASKRRKVVERTVVTVKVGENGGKVKNEGPPSDLWSWRKYGQKPIKGSPYPRCSTSKGCSAKKQVERCKTDASLLIITYTASHNHPGPDLESADIKQSPEEPQSNRGDDCKQEQVVADVSEQEPDVPQNEGSNEEAGEDHFHYLQSPFNEDSFIGNVEKTHDSLGFLLDEEPLSCPRITTTSTPKSEENDFFDELEELYPYLQLSQVS